MTIEVKTNNPSHGYSAQSISTDINGSEKQSRKSPYKHEVKKYIKKDGTVVSSHSRGGGHTSKHEPNI